MSAPLDTQPSDNLPLLSPLARYQQCLQEPDFKADSNQYQAILQLDALFQVLQSNANFSFRKKSPQSLFLWGQVGIGKTFLMDLFFDSLPEKNKLRLHFHRFMALIHQELKNESGQKDPLSRVARRLFKKFQVLCLDELFITDIGDGMIIYRLLEEFFNQGLILVTTSNFPIESLYKDDLQPKLFEPAITLLRSKTKQIHLGGIIDYRLDQAHPEQTYFLQEEKNFTDLFHEVNQDALLTELELLVCNRPISVIRHSLSTAWFSFDALCYGTRSPLDYIELANRYQTILLSEVPILGGKPKNQIKARGTEDGSLLIPTGERKVFYALEDNAARRFISLIDALYDSKVTLYISATVALQDIYIGEALCFEFKRTQSRLIEMQSMEYLLKQ